MRNHTYSNAEIKCQYSGSRKDSPPPAIVAFIRESSSSSPLIASCKWRGVILFTFKSLEQFPANSNTYCYHSDKGSKDTSQPLTSAVRYSRIAALYTAAVAPTLPLEVARDLRSQPWPSPSHPSQPSLQPKGETKKTHPQAKGKKPKSDQLQH